MTARIFCMSKRAWLWTFVSMLAVALVVLALTASTDIAWARPGGGSSFKGGSKSSGGGRSGGGGGGGGDGIGSLLIWLVLEHPALGIPILLIVIGIGAYNFYSKSQQREWSTTTAAPTSPSANSSPSRGGSRELEAIRNYDENFSVVLFEDFLYALYAQVHTARGQNRLPQLSAYVAADVSATLARSTGGPISDVVVGAMRVLLVNHGNLDGFTRVQVEFETNYTETYQGRPQASYVREQWWLSRRVGVVSRTPDRARVFGCPNCGAPQEHVMAGSCKYCKQQVATGNFDWLVTRVDVLAREARGPMLTATTEEEGTDEPTRVDRQAHARMVELSQRDPEFTQPAFLARVNTIFQEFQVAWTNRDLTKMRALLTDNLFETQQYWVQTYTRAGLWNVIERSEITKIDLARVTTDKFYDAITVRVFAQSLDYTIDGNRRVVSGSNRKLRRYTEYWTLIRGTQRKGAPRSDLGCPNCGAPLQVNMAGSCTHCKAKITTGDFDWVLSRIEQDETYEG